MKEKPITNITDKKINRIGKMTSYPNTPTEGAVLKSRKLSPYGGRLPSLESF
jgi:hypothetical protein